MKTLLTLTLLLVAGCGADVEGWLQPPDFGTSTSPDLAMPETADMAAPRDLALLRDLAHAAADLTHEDGGCRHR